MVGFKIELDGHICQHALPPPAQQKILEDPVAYCTYCLQLGHFFKKCMIRPKGFKKGKKKEEEEEAEEEGTPNQGIKGPAGTAGT